MANIIGRKSGKGKVEVIKEARKRLANALKEDKKSSD